MKFGENMYDSFSNAILKSSFSRMFRALAEQEKKYTAKRKRKKIYFMIWYWGQNSGGNLTVNVIQPPSFLLSMAIFFLFFQWQFYHFIFRHSIN